VSGVAQPTRILPHGEPPTGQVAFVVHALEDALTHWLGLGIGPWNVWTFDAKLLPRRTYRGREGSFAARVALCSIGPLTYELIESLTGPSIWDDFLCERGPGMHHFGYYVDDIDGAIEAMEAKGYPVVQTGAGFGLDDDGAFVYFDTTAHYGCYYEAIQAPRALPKPDKHVPLTEQ
jgi:hypothetical protein